MIKITSICKKATLVLLLLGLGLAALPPLNTLAAGTSDKSTPPSGETASYDRLERGWAHLQRVYNRQEERLNNADEFIAKIQGLIDRATTRGFDASAVQAALDAFASVIPAASTAHAAGAAIVASHPGFDESGMITDRATAFETVKSLGKVIRDTRQAMDGAGEALRDSIRAFRNAHTDAFVENTPNP